VTPIDELIRRVTTDPTFRAELVRDPKGALTGYELSAHDLQRLAAQLADDEGSDSGDGFALRRLLTRTSTD
jgi:hypothetical protein